MANPADHDNRTPSERDNTGRPRTHSMPGSATAQRAKRQALQKYTLAAVLLCFCLVLAMLAVMLVGGIIANSSDDDKGQGSHDMKWGEKSVAVSDTQQGPLILVNDQHAYTFPSNTANLAKISDVFSQNPEHPYEPSGLLGGLMDRDALTAMDTMLTDFKAATGTDDVRILYAYRSYEDQKELSDNNPSAQKPGYSDHHTGYGVNMNHMKNGTPYALNEAPYTWIAENCHKYGFIVRYPSDKKDKTGVEYDDYFRYVGIPHATYMKENNLCMEEYVELLKSKTYKKPLEFQGTDGNKYCVYYAAVSSGGTTVNYPTNYAYTMSGTNEGGVVITVNLSSTSGNTEADTSAS